MNSNVASDGLMYDYMRLPPFTVTVGCVRANAYFLPHISDDIVMHILIKGGAFEFIGIGCRKNSIVLCESRKEWFAFFVIYKSHM